MVATDPSAADLPSDLADSLCLAVRRKTINEFTDYNIQSCVAG